MIYMADPAKLFLPFGRRTRERA